MLCESACFTCDEVVRDRTCDYEEQLADVGRLTILQALPDGDEHTAPPTAVAAYHGEDRRTSSGKPGTEGASSRCMQDGGKIGVVGMADIT